MSSDVDSRVVRLKGADSRQADRADTKPAVQVLADVSR